MQVRSLYWRLPLKGLAGSLLTIHRGKNGILGKTHRDVKFNTCDFSVMLVYET